MPEVIPELDDAVRQLYDVFARQPRRAQIEFCSHCVSPQEAEALVETPLREIGADLLRVFVLNAMAETWGDWEHLRCYLPRVLELVGTGGLDNYDICGLFFGMGLRWRDWPDDQQLAISGYLSALWGGTVSGYWHPCALDVLDILQAAGDLGISVAPFLRDWETRGGETAALHLAWLISHGADRWEKDPASGWGQVLSQWLIGPAPRRVLRSALAVASGSGANTSRYTCAAAFRKAANDGTLSNQPMQSLAPRKVRVT